MPFQLSPALIAGLVLWAVGVGAAVAILGRHGGLAFGPAAWTNLGALFRDPAAGRSRRWLYGAVATAVLGGLVTCGAMVVGDAEKHRRCKGACVAEGWDTGRVRGNPHERPAPQPVTRCWCERGGEWSREPLPIRAEGGGIGP